MPDHYTIAKSYTRYMPTYQTTGIILGRTNFGEADRIIRMLTRDRGKVSAMAKGVRKTTSRAGGHLEPLGEVSLTLATGRNLDIITSARLLWYPHQLTSDYQRLGLALAMTTAIDRLVEPGHAQPALYALLAESLHTVEETAARPLTELWFKLRLLTSLGYRPELGACLHCSRHDADTNYAFNPQLGGLLCQADADHQARPISHTGIKLWRLLCDHPYASIAGIGDAQTLAQDTLASCDEFYEFHLGKTFKLNSQAKSTLT